MDVRVNGNAEALAELERLCGHRWDGHVLLQLAQSEKPMRRYQVGNAVRGASERIPDSQLDRTLGRLVDQQLAQDDRGPNGHKRYRLTEHGRDQAVLLDWLVQKVHDSHETRTGSGALWPARTDSPLKYQAMLPRTLVGGSTFAVEWSNALEGVGPVPLSRVERQRVCAALAGRLHTALLAEPFDPGIGLAVGAELVEAGFAAPAALGRTITIMMTWLPVKQNLEPIEAAIRVIGLVESLARGFAEALQHRILADQDAVRTATMRAYPHAVPGRRQDGAGQQRATAHDAGCLTR